MIVKIQYENLEQANRSSHAMYTWSRNAINILGAVSRQSAACPFTSYITKGNALLVAILPCNDLARGYALLFGAVLRGFDRRCMKKPNAMERLRMAWCLKKILEHPDGGYRMVEVPDLSNS